MEQSTTLRACRLCGQELPLSDYYGDRTSPGGYRTACKSCLKARVAARAKAKRSEIAAHQALYRQRNREAACARTEAYRAMYPEKAKLAMKKWNADPRTRPLRAEYHRRQRARRAANSRVPVTQQALAQKLAHWGGKCWMCRSAEFQAWDHVKPISKGGAHMLANLRPACGDCNRRKGAKWPFPQARRAGR